MIPSRARISAIGKDRAVDGRALLIRTSGWFLRSIAFEDSIDKTARDYLILQQLTC
jgi:hypothetical protein